MDKLFQYVIDVFGYDRLVRASNQAVAELRITKASKQFLSEVGLPSYRILMCEFALNESILPRLNSFLDPKVGNWCMAQSKVRIGSDSCKEIYLDEDKNGQVWCVAPDCREMPQFISSSVEHMGELLAMYAQYAVAAKEMQDAAADEMARCMVEKMKESDPSAFMDSRNWWAAISQQMIVGDL